jgi:hypothetical protein
MAKRITADHVKLKRAYEPVAADDGTPQNSWSATPPATSPASACRWMALSSRSSGREVSILAQ